MQNSFYTVETMCKAFGIGDSKKQQTQTDFYFDKDSEFLKDKLHGKPNSNFFEAANRIEITDFLKKQIEHALKEIPSDDRELWVAFGHAAKSMDISGGSEGKKLWLEWSKKSEKFDAEDAEEKWASFKPNKTSPEAILCKALNDYGWDVQAANKEITALLFTDIDSTAVPTDRLNICSYDTGFLDSVKTLPQRDWLIPRFLIINYASIILGPGGVSKSTFQLVLAISVAAGLDLLGFRVKRQAKVLLINNEDDASELTRRIAAILTYYKIDEALLKKGLFTLSGYEEPIKFIWQNKDGVMVHGEHKGEIESFIIENHIEALFVDPFISTHNVSENDNTYIDKVVSAYKAMAGKLNIAINIVHHTRKNNNDSESHAGDAESGRGASSLKDAARAVTTIARMSATTAKKLDIHEDERGKYVRVDVGKSNFTIHETKARWFYLESVRISNGESIGVPIARNLDLLFAMVDQHGGAKWKRDTVAIAVDLIFIKGQTEIPWSDLRERFMSANNIGRSVANEKVTLLPNVDNDEKPIRIRQKEYWITRSAPKNGWMVHCQELSE